MNWTDDLEYADWRLAVPVPIRELWDTFTTDQQRLLQSWAVAVNDEDHIVAQNAVQYFRRFYQEPEPISQA